MLGRLDAARALVKTAKDRPEAVAKALAAAWKREKAVPARQEMSSQLMADGDEVFRAALIDAAGSSEARVRVAAIDGLAKLKRDARTEALFRTAWTNPREAYGARGPRSGAGRLES